MKKNPGKVNYASPGAGTAHHLAGELYKLETKTEITHVPYRGAGPAMQDLLAGNVDMMFDGMGTSASQIRAGRLIGLAVATPQAPAGVPRHPDRRPRSACPTGSCRPGTACGPSRARRKPIVDRMYAEMRQGDGDAQAAGASGRTRRRRWAASRRPTFAKRIRTEIEKWQKVVPRPG